MGAELGVRGNGSHSLQSGPVPKSGDREAPRADVKGDRLGAKHADLRRPDRLRD